MSFWDHVACSIKKFRNCATGWTTRVPFFTGAESFSFAAESRLKPKPTKPTDSYWVLHTQRKSSRGVNLNFRLHRVPRLRRRGVSHTHVRYDFTAWHFSTETVLYHCKHIQVYMCYNHLDFLLVTSSAVTNVLIRLKTCSSVRILESVNR
jgi:hypothetical protein